MPGFLKYPQVEVKAFMVMNMGMLDSGADVLVDVGAAAGWRIIGAMECSCALIFIHWFWSKGRDFQESNDFLPSKNVRQNALFLAIDEDGDGELTLEELKDAAPKLRMVGYDNKNCKSYKVVTSALIELLFGLFRAFFHPFRHGNTHRFYFICLPS